MATPGALASQSHQELIERIYEGDVPQHIARELGVHHSSIYRFLATHPEYQQARKVGMAVRLDVAEQAVLTADERTLSRAREAWRCVTWRAEREHPETWGQVAKLTGADGGPIQVQIVKFAGTIIDGAAQYIDDPVKPILAELQQVIDRASK